MPRVTVPKKVFEQKVGQVFEFDELEKKCFDFGMEIEVEDIEDPTTKKVTGQNYIFETAANRPDLLSTEGIVSAFQIFQGKEELPQFKIIKPTVRQQIVVKKNTEQIRPFVVGAILRNITFDADSYQSFIDLQTKLHFNHCRRRRLVAIGTHDLDTVEGPFVYDAQAPEQIKFAPLNQEKVMNGREIIEFYEQDRNLREFCPIIKDSPVYPVIYDKNNTVLSLPPLINGNHSKMSKDTKNVLIECTATDYTRASQALNVMITSFSQYCQNKYEIEEVDIIYEETKETKVTPNLKENEFTLSVEKVKKLGTFDTNVEEIIKLLKKMQYIASPSQTEGLINVLVPSFRSDILQECDIAEDVCIAYGYNNITKCLPTSFTIGKQQILNKLSDLVREEVAACGYQEGLNFALNNENDLTTNLCRLEDLDIVKIQNPRTIDYTCGRTTLIPGCLKWLSHNKVNKLPIKLFELSDVILKDSSLSVGARNERRVCALFYNKSAQLEIIHGLLDTIMTKLKVSHGKNSGENYYTLEEISTPTFFPQRQARVLFKDKEIGVMGILHPNVLKQYALENPVSLLEINLEPLLNAFINE